jgi:hypothetical protein
LAIRPDHVNKPVKLQLVNQTDTGWIGPCPNDLKALPDFGDQPSWPIA